MARFALPAWARPSHPIVRYERRHWQASAVWRVAGSVLWGGSLVFLLVPAACSILFTVTSTFQTPAELVLGIGGLFSVGLVLITALLSGLNSLSASILGATLIARERESQTWTFLRLTTLPSHELALGKLMALFYTLARPVILITALRGLAVVSGLVTVALAYFVSGLTPEQFLQITAALVAEITTNPAELLPGLVFGLLGALAGLVFWLVEPLWSVVYNGVLGLAASTVGRSRGAAIGLVFALHFGIGLGLYAPAQQLSLLATAPLVQLPGALSVLLPVGIIVIQTLLLVVLNWGVLIGALIFSLRRVETLGE